MFSTPVCDGVQATSVNQTNSLSASVRNYWNLKILDDLEICANRIPFLIRLYFVLINNALCNPCNKLDTDLTIQLTSNNCFLYGVLYRTTKWQGLWFFSYTVWSYRSGHFASMCSGQMRLLLLWALLWYIFWEQMCDNGGPGHGSPVTSTDFLQILLNLLDPNFFFNITLDARMLS